VNPGPTFLIAGTMAVLIAYVLVHDWRQAQRDIAEQREYEAELREAVRQEDPLEELYRLPSARGRVR
jgi:hypothetical protein